MGQSHFNYNITNSLYQFPIYQYTLKERLSSSLTLWQHKHHNNELLEAKLIVDTQQKLKQIYEIFLLRYQHMYVVSTLYLSCEQTGIKGCGEVYKGNMFYEIPLTNLSKINDIPFYDSLHLYAVAFKGFQILFSKFGYFDVFEDMFHVCETGKVKVWCNSTVYKCAPEAYLMDSHGREEDMVYRIMHLIDINIDRCEKQSVKRQIEMKVQGGLTLHTFDDGNYIFRHICREKGWYAPEKLTCLASFTKEQVQRLLCDTSLKKSEEEIKHHHELGEKINTQQSIINQFPLKTYPQRTEQMSKNNSMTHVGSQRRVESPVKRKCRQSETNHSFQPEHVRIQPTCFQPQQPQAVIQPQQISQMPHKIEHMQPHYYPIEQNPPQIQQRAPSPQPQIRPQLRTPSLSKPSTPHQQAQSFRVQINQQKPKLRKVSKQLISIHNNQIQSEKHYRTLQQNSIPMSQSLPQQQSNRTVRQTTEYTINSTSIHKKLQTTPSQYTDPKLMELLSSRGSKQKEGSIADHLLYSFSKKSQEITHGLENHSQKQSQSRIISIPQSPKQKVYRPLIDNDIWQDLQKLKIITKSINQ